MEIFMMHDIREWRIKDIREYNVTMNIGSQLNALSAMHGNIADDADGTGLLVLAVLFLFRDKSCL